MCHIWNVGVGHDLVIQDQGTLAACRVNCEHHLFVRLGDECCDWLGRIFRQALSVLAVEPSPFGLWACALFLRVFVGRVGGRCRGGEVGERRAVLSSSHVDVARSSSRRRLNLGGGAGRVRGGNSMARYCWMMGQSFFPSWKACSPSLKAAPATVPQSTFVPSYVASMTPALCFGIP